MTKPSSILDIYFQAKTQHPEKTAFFFSYPKFSDGLTYEDVWTLAIKQAQRFIEIGIRPQDRVGIWAPTSWRWEIAQLAVLICGAVVVGIDLNEPEKNFSKIEELTDLKYILYEHEYLISKWNARRQSSVKFIPLFLKFDNTQQPNVSLYPAFSSRPKDENQDAFIFFTSGTTSEPKAISYSHKKMVTAVQTLIGLFPEVSQLPRTVCWLPLSNLFQRMSNFSVVASGGEIFFLENPVEVANSLSKINPNLFISVPRFFEKIYDSFIGQADRLMFPLNQVFLFGLHLLILQWRYRRNRAFHLILSTVLIPWNIFIFKKIRALFGNPIKILISGSAPIRREILTFFHALGLPVLEVYGVSENVIPISANRLSQFKLGSVGKPVIADSVKISDDGEILVKNEGLFSKYIKRSTEEYFQNGFYKTGDLGYFDRDGFLYLLGRKTEMFKTGTGKKVAISEIETVFKSLAFIDQVVVLGEGKKIPFVVLTIDFSQLALFLHSTLEDIFDVENGTFSKVHALKIESAIQAVANAADLAVKPGGALVLTRRFTMEGDEITTNLKIKRKSIERKFSRYLDILSVEVENRRDFPIHFIGSAGNEIYVDTAVGKLQRLSEVAKIVLKILVCGVPVLFRFQPKRKYYRLIGQFLRIGLGGLRGPFQKVGQMMSLVSDDIPIEIREELTQLFHDSEPVNAHLIRSIVERELKKPLAGMFCEWSDKPISTGSIGQVHWARLYNGQEVAVKVLIPRVEEILKSDLSLLKLLIPILTRILKFKSLPYHYEELKELMMAEVDLIQEAENYQTFKSIFSGMPDVIVPEVYLDYCSSKVLVTEFVHGKSFSEFNRDADMAQKQRVAELLWISASLPINVFATFNADPHMGNFIIVDDSKIAMVDFGFCKKWDHEFLYLWKKQILSCCNHDRAGFKKYSQLLGIRNDRNPNFFDELYDINHKVLYKPWLTDQDFHFDRAWMQAYLHAILKYQIMVSGLEVPKNFLAFSRLYWVNFDLMAKLNVTLNFYQLTIPFLEAPIVETIPLAKSQKKAE